jgi:hypothetical protein
MTVDQVSVVQAARDLDVDYFNLGNRFIGMFSRISYLGPPLRSRSQNNALHMQQGVRASFGVSSLPSSRPYVAMLSLRLLYRMLLRVRLANIYQFPFNHRPRLHSLALYSPRVKSFCVVVLPAPSRTPLAAKYARLISYIPPTRQPGAT